MEMGVALETGVSVAPSPMRFRTVLLEAEHRPGAGLSLDGRTRLAVVVAPNHTPWRLAAWLCRRKHASAPVGPRLAAAVKLLELGRLSSGAAARLAGLAVPVFLARLADYGVSAFRMNEAEIREDAQRA